MTGIPELEPERNFCETCVTCKLHRSKFPKATKYQAKKPLELVHTDICGLISPITSGGNRYFLLLVDDFSRYMWIEFFRNKNRALMAFKKVKADIEVQSERRIKILRTDRGGEFL